MPDGSAPTASLGATPRFRLAIVGGGIAGLTLAITLGRYEDRGSPIKIDLYEAGPEITTVGAGISVWTRTWEVMRQLGIYDELAGEAVRQETPIGENKENKQDSATELKPAFVLRKSDWQRDGYDFGYVMIPNGSTTMHRAEMVDVLVRHLPASCSIHTSKRLLSYTETTGNSPSTTAYLLNFEDGTTAEADVIVGADGIKSKTRATMYQYIHERDCAGPVKIAPEACETCGHATPKWTGTVAYRFLIPTEKLREVNPTHRALEVKCPMSYGGKGKHIITYPISHGRYLNWIAFVTIPGGEGTAYPKKWVTDATYEELASYFTGWESEVDQMISCVEKPTLWGIHIVDDLPFNVSGRVALVGDAVHAMETHFGAGGGQAIEDAYLLGLMLSDSRVTLSRVSDVFQIYQDIRLPFAQNVVKNAAKVGRMYEFRYPGLYDGMPVSAGKSEEEELETTKARLNQLSGAVQELWKWQWMERAEDQWEEARRRLEEALRGQVVKLSANKMSKFCLVM
ncbi:FAD/NAD(P)-binding domain-containing protein [Lentinus tigrinus ALCF2SS1-7]|uniref:FAD/NAD(P)-binding domain-containing protein n=1 Tax=Lentinus tigrinus ALCF2SS1-6 TaxID=1328759 RepID=A0A5C2RR67_9APHY|nr:FAD/NAD(P)-binding domain-containing protein [Lentinus tigrinus ALCF2SS1-6]RPD68886.1 FAD/NAD(P)-binding domain-containing protein [Lentinus tigrinus ALCF2SS1-7]